MRRKPITAGLASAIACAAFAAALVAPAGASGPGLFDANPSNLSCGSHLIFGTYGCGAVKFTNNTAQPLTIIGGGVEITGANASEFSTDGSGFALACATGVTVPPGGSCGVNVYFSPSDVGRRTATLNLFDGTSDEPERIRVTGRGLPPEH